MSEMHRLKLTFSKPIPQKKFLRLHAAIEGGHTAAVDNAMPQIISHHMPSSTLKSRRDTDLQ
jgi:hypothetical protein